MHFFRALIVVLLFSTTGFSEIIFSEDYDSISDGWNCSDSTPPGWSGGADCPSSASDGVDTHYAGEITSGGRTGNSLKLWRKNGSWTEYHGYLNRDLTSTEFDDHHKELFSRWYVKIDTSWDANPGGETHKLNRFYYGSSSGAKTGEWYMDVKGSTFKTGKFSFYTGGGGGVRYAQQTISQMGVNDGNWHSLEWRVKLNSTTGSSDGALQFFVDGEAKNICDGVGENCTTETIMNFGAATDDYFTSTLPPAIGNLTGGSWNFPTSGWYSFEFDDYVVADEYIGPTNNGSSSLTSGSGATNMTASGGGLNFSQ